MTPSETAVAAARANAIGRLAVGTALLAAPQIATAGWVGTDADRPSVGLLGRAVGIRDVVLGAAVLIGLANGKARPALAASALADVGDLGATLAAGDSVAEPGRTMSLAVIAGGILSAAVPALVLD